MRRVALSLLAVLLGGGAASVATAAAAPADRAVAQAAERLQRDSVYVARDADPKVRLSRAAAARLRVRIASGGLDARIAVLGAAGDPDEALRRVAAATGRPGTYLVVSGRTLRASSDALPADRVAPLARTAFERHRAAGIEAVLVATLDALATGAEADDDGTGPVIAAVTLVATIVGVLGLVTLRDRRRARRAGRGRRRRGRGHDHLMDPWPGLTGTQHSSTYTTDPGPSSSGSEPGGTL